MSFYRDPTVPMLCIYNKNLGALVSLQDVGYDADLAAVVTDRTGSRGRSEGEGGGYRGA